MNEMHQNVVDLVKEAATTPDLVLDPREPLVSAREFLARQHTVGELHTLHFHRGEFFDWDGTAYRPVQDAELRAELYDFLDRAKRIKGKLPEPFRPNRSKVNDVLDALKAAANLSATVSPPTWLDTIPDLNAPPEEYIVVANGLLHVPTRELHPPTPAFFATNALPVAFDPEALDPTEWLAFLESLWPDDRVSINTLQEIFGYALVPDTRQQKIFMLVGPKRSGKGTIARCLTGILGGDNVAAPTLRALGTNFGLAPMIGKTLATITDARLGGRADQAAIAERLLSLSGEDLQTIDRKYLPAWTGRLPTRFLILTNELPRITDASGALASRFIVMMLTESFYGREDLMLPERIAGELTAILSWALDGLDRLRERGHFIQPASAGQAVEDLETLGAPVSAFVRDRCIVAPGLTCEVDALFKAWQEWCADNGRQRPGTKQTFGRDLHAALPGLSVTQPREGNQRYRVYEGIELRLD